VIAGREVRDHRGARGAVDAEPLDSAIEATVRKLLGLELDLEAFHAFAQGEEVLAATVGALSRASVRRSRRIRLEALVSSITAQQVSLHAAFAVRSRFVDRFGSRRNWPSPFRPVSGWRSRRRRS
jgi:3-methyladenine DNA glycosylase/8-oxoguanine DNA glycosylase